METLEICTFETFAAARHELLGEAY